MAAKNFRILNRQTSIHFYEKPGDTNYIASCLVTLQGDRAILSVVNGRRFYEFMVQHLHEILAELQVRWLEGYVSIPHARLVRRSFRGKAAVIDRGTGYVDGHPMIWLAVTV